MGKKLYVGNLSFGIDSDQLTDVFAAFGTVDSANVITDRDSGRSKGFGFVEMSTDGEAQTAIEKLNGFEVAGRALNVSEAKPQEKRDGPRRSGGGFGSRRAY